MRYSTPEAGVILYTVEELDKEEAEYAMQHENAYKYESKKNSQTEFESLPCGGAIPVCVPMGGASWGGYGVYMGRGGGCGYRPALTYNSLM